MYVESTYYGLDTGGSIDVNFTRVRCENNTAHAGMRCWV